MSANGIPDAKSISSGAGCMKGAEDPNVDLDTFIGANMADWKGLFVEKFGRMNPDLAGNLTDTEVDVLVQSCINWAKRILVCNPDVPKSHFFTVYLTAVARLEVVKNGAMMQVSFNE